MAANYNIQLDAGADYSLVFTYEDPSGSPINLSGYSAALTVAPAPQGAVSLVLATGGQGIVVNGPAGTLTVTFTNAQTDGLPQQSVYMLEITSGSGVVTRLVQGNVLAAQEVGLP